MWWYYLVAIPAAVLLINGIPHFTHGIAGKSFPTPFVGGAPHLDTPGRNVLWGGGNLLAGGILLRLISPGLSDWLLVAELAVVGLGFAMLLSRLMQRT